MELNYKSFGTGFPVIILHGLLGSLDNWQSIAKKLAAKFQVFIVDHRNHGKSPHSDAFNYQLLANDLLEFMQQHGLDKANIIGHSMGGKTAMQFALLHPDKVAKLIVVDAVPTAFDDRHSHVFDALFAADVRNATSREQVESILRNKLNDETTVQFLLKGLNRDAFAKHFEWKFNAEALWKNYNHISLAITSNQPYAGEVLFVKGGNSDYINTGNYAGITELFPHHQLAEIKDAGHWVHADKPDVFVEEVLRFL